MRSETFLIFVGLFAVAVGAGVPTTVAQAQGTQTKPVPVQAGYESRPGFPVIERDGTNPSTLELKRANIVSLFGGLNVPLG